MKNHHYAAAHLKTRKSHEAHPILNLLIETQGKLMYFSEKCIKNINTGCWLFIANPTQS